MKFSIALVTLVIAVCLVPDASAWWGHGWGWGGIGRWGGFGWPTLGWGGIYSPYSWGYRYFRDTFHGDTGRVACEYLPGRSILNCEGSSGVVDCGVVANFTGMGPSFNYEYFGLSRPWYPHGMTHMNHTIDTYKYRMFPRQLDGSGFLNHTFTVEGKQVTLSLFHSLMYNYYGFRVPDLACFERLVSLFRNVPYTRYQNVTIGSLTGFHYNVSLFGDVLLRPPVV